MTETVDCPRCSGTGWEPMSTPGPPNLAERAAQSERVREIVAGWLTPEPDPAARSAWDWARVLDESAAGARFVGALLDSLDPAEVLPIVSAALALPDDPEVSRGDDQ